MTQAPSEYQDAMVSDIMKQVYFDGFHDDVEQSAIYADVMFSAVEEKDFGIVLTPQCDIQKYGPNDYVLLARIVSVAEVLLYWLLEKNGYTEDEAFGKVPVDANKKKRKSVVKEFAENYLKNQTYTFHFIPEHPSNGLQSSLICFEVTECLRVESLNRLEKVTVLRSPFREAVPARFSSYVGRIGTPTFEPQYFLDQVARNCKLRD